MKMVNMKYDTGDPNCPDIVRTAKRAYRSVQDNYGIVISQSGQIEEKRILSVELNNNNNVSDDNSNNNNNDNNNNNSINPADYSSGEEEIKSPSNNSNKRFKFQSSPSLSDNSPSSRRNNIDNQIGELVAVLKEANSNNNNNNNAQLLLEQNKAILEQNKANTEAILNSMKLLIETLVATTATKTKRK
jgi:hypothetical protein